MTSEEQSRWERAMIDTWSAIAPDVLDALRLEARESGRRVRLSAATLVEIVCDANRLEMYGGLTDEEGRAISAVYSTRKFQSWARSVMRGYEDSVEPPPKPRQSGWFRTRRPAPGDTKKKLQKLRPKNYWERAGYTTYTGAPRMSPPPRIVVK